MILLKACCDNLRYSQYKEFVNSSEPAISGDLFPVHHQKVKDVILFYSQTVLLPLVVYLPGTRVNLHPWHWQYRIIIHLHIFKIRIAFQNIHYFIKIWLSLFIKFCYQYAFDTITFYVPLCLITFTIFKCFYLITCIIAYPTISFTFILNNILIHLIIPIRF